MASLTIRKLDEELKALLRLRAASHGRSVEDEVRVILREAADQREASASAPQSQPAPRRHAPATASGKERVTLIIGGGIAAYKALDLIRRLKDRGLIVQHPPAKGAFGADQFRHLGLDDGGAAIARPLLRDLHQLPWSHGHERCRWNLWPRIGKRGHPRESRTLPRGSRHARP